MRARISGRAAAYAVKVSKGWELGYRGRSRRVEVAELDVTRALGGTPDVVEIEARTMAEVERRLETEWSKDRAIRIAIMLLDPSEPDEGLDQLAAVLEQLLGVAHVLAHVENQFAQRELPIGSLIDRACLLATDLPRLREMLSRIAGWQPTIGRVRESFARLDESLFGGPAEKAAYREQAIAAGAFRCLVEATSSGKLTSVGVFELHNALRPLKNARDIVHSWTAAFERVSIELPPLPADLAEDLEEHVQDFGGGPGGHERLQNALDQQRAIIERVAAGDYENARRFVRDLVQSQLADGGASYLAKSLTRLSQRAREMEAYELSLEWAYEAVMHQSDDARAHTQLADALLQADRFDEALEQFKIAAECGEAGYAATGRARVLRLLGRFEEALVAFSDAAQTFKGSEHEIYALVGITSVQYDMGDLNAALLSSREIVERFPEADVPHLNLGGLLVRRGDFKEAWDQFSEAEKYSSDKVSALNGMADIYRRVGRLGEARSRYAKIVEHYPTDVTARLGLIDTLRALGEYDKASIFVRQTVERFPGSSRVHGKYGEVASEMGRYSHAKQILAEAIGRFPRDARLVLVKASCERRAGRYERALSTLDAAVERFPYNRRFVRARADMLRRLGNLQSAENLYRTLVEEDQADTRSKNGLASLLILKDQFAIADKLLANDDPVTADDWRGFLLRSELCLRGGDISYAKRRLVWAVENCPFAAERRLFVCAMAKQSAALGQARRAPRIFNIPERDIGNVISFQLAAMSRSANASAAYAILSKNLPTRYELLREEIARNYGLSRHQARRSKSWIMHQLNDEFILAVA